MKKLLLAICCFLLLVATCLGATRPLALAWDESDDPRIQGYFLYWGYSSGNYSGKSDVGYTQSAIFSAHPGNVYYFVVTAYDMYGIESLYSNELSVGIPFKEPPKGPIAIGPPPVIFD